jgi:hypothetical protein
MPNMFSEAFHHGAGRAEFERPSKEVSTEMFGILADKTKRTGQAGREGSWGVCVWCVWRERAGFVLAFCQGCYSAS